MKLSGKNFIGGEKSSNGKVKFKAINPSTGDELSTAYHEATVDEVDEAVKKAEKAFGVYNTKSPEEKAVFLETIADEIMSLEDELITVCSEETGLAETRLIGERGRTVNQLKLFASVIREGSWVDARIDTAQPDRTPMPKPDVRSVQKALGPVGIFGAGNFPLAFSVAGGDTASALAAGCTIVVKAHPAHPGTSELAGLAILSAAKKSGMPDGTFSLLHGQSNDVGMAMVGHSLVKAVGFTGSFRGGKAIFDAAVKRKEPIPVFAEMGSTNPVFILPEAMKKKKQQIADGLTASVVLGVGQFCTNPGLVFLNKSEDSVSFFNSAKINIENAASGVMLTSAIRDAYDKGRARLEAKKGVDVLSRGMNEGPGYQGTPALLGTSAANFFSSNEFEEEIFGPSTLTVTADSKEELIEAARKLGGHLTATLWATESDLEEFAELVTILERKVGRLIINGFPTGVEVCHAMIHGGPFPATTDSRSTSVGTSAIRRFTRPVCYQNFPDRILPDELKNDNPLNIWRLVDGEYKK